ncbi:hypothetical protein [Pseudomonas tohonis]|uniref:hypothetical protein n=1 Tax=Pseudomonas tohonis TaxID=2725477 RepID=UPI0021D7E48E|nr:hypothetical protein [Pseudomonas tohonis]UXY53968.1 hypothetical protein N9L84_05080 [Pseudomonas tohonis]
MNLYATLSTVALLAATFATSTYADEVQEAPPKYIESAVIILNLTNKTDEGASGFLLATPCTGCEPLKMQVTNRTALYLQGKPSGFSELGMKIDWQGSVFYEPGTPPTVTELFLN